MSVQVIELQGSVQCLLIHRLVIVVSASPSTFICLSPVLYEDYKLLDKPCPRLYIIEYVKSNQVVLVYNPAK